MNPSRIFIQRPIATSLLMLALFLAGWLGYRLLPISALPEVAYPTMQITTLYPGASAELTATTITAPLERQLSQIPGLTHMSSSSSGGASVINLRFTLDLPLDMAEQQVQAAINASANLLPNDLPAPPVYNKVNPADAPILTVAVTSAALPISRIHDLVETRLAQKLSQVPGVGLVSIDGGHRPAVRIQLNPNALAALNLSSEDIRTAITGANVNQPKGSFDGAVQSSVIDANDQLKSAKEYADLVLAYKNGTPIRLRDVASLVDDVENTRLGAWSGHACLNAHPATPCSATYSRPTVMPGVILTIQRQPGANVIETVDRIKALLPQLQTTLPASLDVHILSDRTTTIRASVSDMQFELVLAIALVVLVIFLFIRSLSALLIPAIAVPLSLVGTFGLMYLAGFSINNLTLMALTISTGFIVDDAIVMIENIARYIEAGMAPLQAAYKGSQQIAFTIISLTISLLAVLIPLFFMSDLVGRLFHEFALTMAAAIVLSAIVSLTLTPMMCAYWLKARSLKAAESHGSPLFQRLLSRYGQLLRQALQHQTLVLLGFSLTLLLTVLLYIWVPKGFFPEQDTGLIQATTQATPGVSFRAMAEQQERLAYVLLQDPDVAKLSSFIGVDGRNTALHNGRMLITLKPHKQRASSVQQIMRRLTQAVQQQTHMDIYLQSVQDLTIEDQSARTQYQLSLSSPHPEDLAVGAQRLEEALYRLPQLRDVTSDSQAQGPQVFIDIDRDASSRLGVSVAAINTALYNAFGQRLISTIFTQSSQYRVVLEHHPQFQTGPDALAQIYVMNSAHQSIPLSSLAQLKQRTAPLAIHHLDQFPSHTLSFNLAPGVALGSAVKAIDKAANEIGLPPSVDLAFQGAAKAFEASLKNSLLLILAAIVTIYIVLGVLYESTIHPLTILSTLPSATLGALLALLAFRLDLGVIAIIGIVLLIGIVKKNAIMMIDFALYMQREQKVSSQEAIYQAAMQRFRPILMTTLAALGGAIPMLVDTGVGHELRQPLGVTMVGGLLVSQLLTLFTTPVIYVRFDAFIQRLRGPQQPPHDVAKPSALP